MTRSNVIPFPRRPARAVPSTWHARTAGWAERAVPLVRAAIEILDEPPAALDGRLRRLVGADADLVIDLVLDEIDAATEDLDLALAALRAARSRLAARLAAARPS